MWNLIKWRARARESALIWADDDGTDSADDRETARMIQRGNTRMQYLAIAEIAFGAVLLVRWLLWPAAT
jgi:hypothetical protein